MVEDHPVAAFTLSIVGLALQALGGVAVIFWGFFWRSSGYPGYGMMGPWMMGFFPYASSWWPLAIVFGVAVIVIGVLGALWMNTNNLSKIRTGSTLVLVASVIAFPTMFGFMLGSILMFIGGLLGLTWRPIVAPQMPPASPT